MSDFTKAEYKELMAKIADGGKVSRKTFDAMTAFAKAKKIKRPSEDAILDEATIKAAKKETKKGGSTSRAPKVKAKCDPSSVGSTEKCTKDARSNGLCAAHYSRLVYRAKPENAEKARQASKNYAAKVRAEKVKNKAAAA